MCDEHLSPSHLPPNQDSHKDHHLLLLQSQFPKHKQALTDSPAVAFSLGSRPDLFPPVLDFSGCTLLQERKTAQPMRWKHQKPKTPTAPHQAMVGAIHTTVLQYWYPAARRKASSANGGVCYSPPDSIAHVPCRPCRPCRPADPHFRPIRDLLASCTQRPAPWARGRMAWMLH